SRVYSKSLFRKTEEFLSQVNLNEEQEREFKEEVVKTALGISNNSSNSKLRTLGFKYGIIDEVARFKTFFLDISYYVHKIFWLEIYKHLQLEEKMSPNVEEDWNYFKDFLDEKDI